MDRRAVVLGVGAGGIAFAVALGLPMAFGGPSRASAVTASTGSEQPDPVLESEYQAFMQWMQSDYPDVQLGSDALTTPYYREYVKTLPGTLVGTDRGMVDASTGRVVAPADATFRIGDKFAPEPSWVQECRRQHVDGQVDPGNCGLWLAMADGNFHPSGGYASGGFTAYTPSQISSAVSAAGYRWEGTK